MLEVQKFLFNSGKGRHDALASLKEAYGIESTLHEDGRVILNYSQINSPKQLKIVRECRGLVLDSLNAWKLVARSFTRFFNYGEMSRSELGLFKWDRSCVQDKEDGSLIILYYWLGGWRINTRGSFAAGNVNNHDITWGKLFEAARKFNYDCLDTKLSYSFELCSRYNKVVRDYSQPSLFLLSAFDKEVEMPFDEFYDNFSYSSGVNKITGLYPIGRHSFSSIEDVQSFVEGMESKDPTYEGCVIRDYRGMRFKLKSSKYVAIHRLHNNGYLSRHKDIAKIVFDGEHEEVLSYYPELGRVCEEVVTILNNEKNNLRKYLPSPGISKKEFALDILSRDDIKCHSVLFTVNNTGCSFDEAWNGAKDTIIKRLFE